MERIAIYVPEILADGSPVPSEIVAIYERELFEIGLAAKLATGLGEEGFTAVRVVGAWRSSHTSYREAMTRYELDVADSGCVRARVLELASRICSDLAQESVYLTLSPIEAITVAEYVAA